MTLRECRVPGCPRLTRRALCIQHRDEANLRAFVGWSERKYGVDLDAIVNGHACPRCGLPVGDRPHEQGTTPTSSRFSRAWG
ncbi:MAG: hypothetical protein ACXV3F_15045 [Frankiaceae bacterium]